MGPPPSEGHCTVYFLPCQGGVQESAHDTSYIPSPCLVPKPGLVGHCLWHMYLFPIQVLPPPFRPVTRPGKRYLPAPKAWKGNGNSMMGELRLHLVPASAPPQTIAYRTMGTK